MITFLREIFRRFPRLLLANLALLLLSGGLETLTLLSLVPVVDCLTLPSLEKAGGVTIHFIRGLQFLGITPTLVHMLIVLLSLQVLASTLSILTSYTIFRTKYAVVRNLLVDSFEDFFSARWYFFSSNSQGALLNMFSRTVVQVGDAFSGVGLLFVLGSRLLCYGAVPLIISWKVTFFCFFLAGLCAWPFLRLGKRAYRLGQIATATANDTMSLLHANLGGAKVVLAYGNQKMNADLLRDTFQEHCRSTIKFQTLSNAIPAAYKPLGLGILMITLLLSRDLGVPFSETGVIMLALLQMLPQVGQLVANKSNLQNLLPAYEQIEGLRLEARRLKQGNGNRIFTSFAQELRFDRVTFSYPDRPLLLKGITLTIQKGQFVAILGESGAGKSTLIDLILALHEPTGGQLTVDGIPLQEFDLRTFRQRVGYVPQETVLFNQSIRENLLWANPTASDEEIRSACGLANATEFIEKLPQQYDTVVGDRGVRLSGGQAQRVSLARAILRKPDLLILDEATSALDTHSERLIQQSVDSISRDTTVIAIAHRLSTIVNADNIFLLKNGRVAEHGNYQSLMKGNGLFSKMARIQGLKDVL